MDSGFYLFALLYAVQILSGLQLQASETPIADDINSSSELEKPDDSNGVEVPLDKCLWRESAKADSARFPHRFIEDSKYTFLRTDNIIALLLAGGASIAMHNTDADNNIWDNCQSHSVFHGFTDESLNIIGSPATHFPAAGLWYAISAENKDELNKGRAYTMLTALSINGAVTLGLKAIRNDEPPNDKGWAWPSGHTSSSFTVASVLDEFYGHKVGIPAYLLATVVAYRMVDTGDHWASDCIFGATLGWVVGHSVAGKYKQLEIAGFDVLPYTVPTVNDKTAMGISLVKQF